MRPVCMQGSQCCLWLLSSLVVLECSYTMINDWVED